jgi:hypothetical protein
MVKNSLKNCKFLIFASRIFLILPEIGFNVMGTIWVFCDVIKCVNKADSFANTSIEGKCVKNPEL